MYRVILSEPEGIWIRITLALIICLDYFYVIE